MYNASLKTHSFLNHCSGGAGTAFSTGISRVIIFCLCFVIVSGCASVKWKKKVEDLDKTTSSYETAIRWGYHDMARKFVRLAEGSQKEPVKNLDGIKISSYDIVGRQLSDEKLEAQQIVIIQYYHKDSLVEKTIRDVQLWKYDENDNKWYLRSGLPVFE